MDDELAAGAGPCGPLDVEDAHHPAVLVHIPHLQPVALLGTTHGCSVSFPLQITLAMCSQAEQQLTIT